VPESRARGYGPGRFSFNVKGGRCEACQGDGMIKVEMHFLPDIYVPCDVCHGKRYNRETLEVTYKGRSIDQVLDMTVEAAHEFFSAVPALQRKLATLLEVGLGYIKLGQSATTLSGGEAQRVKLSLELSKRDTGRTLFILDEPTTGLHFHDIDLLLKVLHRLRDHGNTVVVIEHNLDVVKTADWVIDLGPEGGDGGGMVIAQGTPEDVMNTPASFTGRFLKPILSPEAPRKRASGLSHGAGAPPRKLPGGAARRRPAPHCSVAPARAAARAHRRGGRRQGRRFHGARGRGCVAEGQAPFRRRGHALRPWPAAHAHRADRGVASGARRRGREGRHAHLRARLVVECR
jgi:excinuclease ABC subunit A